MLFLIEHVDRELRSVQFLAEVLGARGYSCRILSISFGIHRILHIRPKVIVFPYGPSVRVSPLDILWLRYRSSVVYVNLNWEQYLSKANFHYKRPQDGFARKLMVHLVWDSSFSDYLLQNGVAGDNIHIVGNLSYELIRKGKMVPSGRDILARFPLSDFDRIVFLPVNHGWAFLGRNDIIKRIQNGYDRATAFQYKEFSDRNLDIFIDWLRRLAPECPRTAFFVRPHPSVSNEDYGRHFTNEKNVFVTHEGTIHDWINRSHMVISTWSSSVIDAAILGKKIALLEPLPRPDWLQVHWNSLVHNIRSLSEFKAFVEGDLDRRPTELVDKLNLESETSQLILQVVEKLLLDGPRDCRIEELSPREKTIAVVKMLRSAARSLSVRFLGSAMIKKRLLRDFL